MTPERRKLARKPTLVAPKFAPVDVKASRAHDPADAPDGPKSYTGLLIVAVGGTCFLAYIFNWAGLQTTLDGYFNGIYAQTQGQTDAVGNGIATAAPYVGLAVAALLVYMVIAAVIRSMPAKKRKGPPPRRELTLHRFVDKAREHALDVVMARELYRIFQAECGAGCLPAELEDSFSNELKLPEDRVQAIYMALLQKVERKPDPKAGEPKLGTVLELMTTVQASPRGLMKPAVLRSAAKAEQPVVMSGAAFVRPARPTAPVAAGR
ncbi:hypothetical protein SAMN05421770_1096 [Granulicella rosea]|uniref:Uncharacterized protein n=2 Tax=Granulicella rosea TaxID=474952 RepID=A0A239M166_9BACT|nr:hypothetical protein SAMN05421770_1096 [Granulicella rosea]